MSKNQTIKVIKMELEKINQEIDLKIIKGVSYVRESRRHRFLMSQLRRLSPSPMTWFGKSFRLISTSMF